MTQRKTNKQVKIKEKLSSCFETVVELKQSDMLSALFYLICV